MPFTAIPTLYGETTFRSRFEAQCAFLLDTLGWKWEYEGFSLMLPNGVMYTPDFRVPQESLVIECRGYENTRGEAQIAGFSGLVAHGKPPFPDALNYLVINSNGGVRFWKREMADYSFQEYFFLGYCLGCRRWRTFRCPCTPRGAPQWDVELHSHKGKLLLKIAGDPDCHSSETWGAFMESEQLLQRRQFMEWYQHSLASSLVVSRNTTAGDWVKSWNVVYDSKRGHVFDAKFHHAARVSRSDTDVIMERTAELLGHNWVETVKDLLALS